MQNLHSRGIVPTVAAGFHAGPFLLKVVREDRLILSANAVTSSIAKLECRPIFRCKGWMRIGRRME